METIKLNSIRKVWEKTLWLFSMLLALGSCSDFDWNQNHDTTLTDFQITTTDADVVIAEDKSNIGETMSFNWSASKAADYSTVFYKILFSASTDFSNPVYQAETEKLSTVNSTELTNNQLNIERFFFLILYPICFTVVILLDKTFYLVFTYMLVVL